MSVGDIYKSHSFHGAYFVSHPSSVEVFLSLLPRLIVTFPSEYKLLQAAEVSSPKAVLVGCGVVLVVVKRGRCAVTNPYLDHWGPALHFTITREREHGRVITRNGQQLVWIPLRAVINLSIDVSPWYDKGLVINCGGGGATKWENHCPKLFCAPPLKTGFNFSAPLLKSGNLLCLAFNMAKTFFVAISPAPLLATSP